jgi:CheY-like chemotaxis protein
VATGVCVGCLGSRQCWICLGTGYAVPQARRGICVKCGGTGRCHLCVDVREPARRPERRRVLVVDDEQHILDLLTIWFDDDARCEAVDTVSDVDQALLSLANFCPDTILCDFRLGHATSADYLPGFRSACPDARIVIHTGSPEHAHAAGIVELGADVVVEKGRISLEQLVDVALAS